MPIIESNKGFVNRKKPKSIGATPPNQYTTHIAANNCTVMRHRSLKVNKSSRMPNNAMTKAAVRARNSSVGIIPSRKKYRAEIANKRLMLTPPPRGIGLECALRVMGASSK